METPSSWSSSEKILSREGMARNLSHVGQIVSLVDLLKSTGILSLPLKELNDPDPREIFLESSVHLRNLLPDLPKSVPGLMAEDEGGEENERKNGKGDKGELQGELAKKDNNSDQ